MAIHRNGWMPLLLECKACKVLQEVAHKELKECKVHKAFKDAKVFKE